MKGIITLAGTAVMALAGNLSTIGAAAAPAPSAGAQAAGGNTPSSSSRHTYINEHGSDGASRVVFLPRTFHLVTLARGCGCGGDIFSTPTYWFGSNAAEGHMHAIST